MSANRGDAPRLGSTFHHLTSQRAQPLVRFTPRPTSIALISKRLATTDSKDEKKPEKEEPKKEDVSTFDLAHTGSLAAQELRGVTRDFAELISGRSVATAALAREAHSQASSHGSLVGDFYGITSSIFKAVPKNVLYFGLAGTIPYLGTSLATVFLAREASRASLGLNNLTGYDLSSALAHLHNVEHVQITYGAIILSFLGALHWGMEFAKYGGEQGWRRLAVGVAPVLFAWPTTFLPHAIALIAQWFGFTGMWLLDQRASTNGWTPAWYATYRFYLSIIVGFSIIGTFAGTSYFGAGAGAVTDSGGRHTRHTTDRVSPLKRIDRVKEKNEPTGKDAKAGKVAGTVEGDIQVEETDYEADSYLQIHNVKKEEEQAEEEKKEEEAKKEEEKQKNEEFQDKRDEHQQKQSPGAMKSETKDRTGDSDESGDDKGDEGKDEQKDEDKDKGDEKEDKDKGEDGEDDKKDEDKGEEADGDEKNDEKKSE